MAGSERIQPPRLTQPFTYSPKLRIYECLFLLNHGVDHLIALLHSMETLPFADKDDAVRHRQDRRNSLRHECGFHRAVG
jgi:hypothetical protein